MMDSATGMKPGERYAVQYLPQARVFAGFFLDGRYYLEPELMTAVGWLEGQRFIYDDLDSAGEPVFPERVAGSIQGLVLTLADGSALQLQRMDVHVYVDASPSAQRLDDGPARATAQPSRKVRIARPGPRLLLGLASALLLGGCAVALVARRR